MKNYKTGSGTAAGSRKRSARTAVETSSPASSGREARRDFLKTLGLGTLGLGFGVSIFDSLFTAGRAAETPADEEGVRHLISVGTVNFMGFQAKEITPNADFYITSYSEKVPQIRAEDHRLRLEGLVEKPALYALQDLEALKDKKEFVTLECIGNPVGGTAVGNAFWEGVTLKRIIDLARPAPGIVKAALFAQDGYSDSIPFSLAVSGEVFLAWRMNGEPLPPAHGFPLRLIVPGIYGMKHVKWLSKIELVNYNFRGYWEKKGWSDEAVIPVKSQILQPMDGQAVPPGRYMIGGIAFAGRHGISRVQVSVDGGKSWAEAHVKPPLSQWAWSLWEYDWQPTTKGNISLLVRGIDRSGKVQESPSLLGKVWRSFPAGARGLHQIQVSVR